MCLHLFWPSLLQFRPCFGVAPRLHICADRFHGISWARPKAIFEETLRKWIKKENFEFYMFFFRFQQMVAKGGLQIFIIEANDYLFIIRVYYQIFIQSIDQFTFIFIISLPLFPGSIFACATSSILSPFPLHIMMLVVVVVFIIREFFCLFES